MKKSYPLAARLGAVILGFESIIMFLGGLFIFGMKATPDGIEPWWGIVAGGVMTIVMIVAAGLCRFQFGIVLGWILQLVVLAGAFLNLAFVIVAAVFGGLWAYAMITSARIARQAPRAAQHTEGD
ncbi:DUF4233 domain-containing protein [Microbacterium sp. NC79]|uniref:DUF4233 domain-containing protein n=1 Tax=Microbacterium sp. NC79 TaxID=2851009 RepID=UPI001C2B7ACF|nr:DUF4233 domain-containing protein [Microbacterium sp. NC79]MBV0894773.1 DUF4233 domain-containing protein [Microbacterium sp. NC79]